VEHERFVPQDQELIEGEAGGRRDIGHKGREPVNAVGNLSDFGLHSCLLNAQFQGTGMYIEIFGLVNNECTC
jgi:hypothetical protein